MGELRGMNLVWLKAISGQTNSVKYRLVFHLVNQLTELIKQQHVTYDEWSSILAADVLTAKLLDSIKVKLLNLREFGDWGISY